MTSEKNRQEITVYKLDHQHQPVWHYSGTILERSATTIVLEAYFNRDDYPTPYHTFKRGDRMVEWFFNDRWYNIFALHHHKTDTLEGWYCNITYPARFTDDAIYAADLALDMMVYPDGRMLILDEDEFAALELDLPARQKAEAALQELVEQVTQRRPPFDSITA